jgi:Flp pilus assembly protein TadG
MNSQGKFSAMKRRQRGQAAVEFALVVVFLVVLLVSILEMTMFIYTYAALTNAAKEGVRYAIVHGASSGATVAGSPVSSPWPTCATAATGSVLSTVQTYAALSLHNASSMSINACYPDGDNKPGSAVQVNVSYSYQPIFGLRWASVTVSANSVGRIMF